MKPANPLFASLPTTVFTRMSALAVANEAINLGQGFPDRNGPDWIIEAATRALREESNQYPPATGIPVLRQAIADHEARFYGLEIDPDREVIVTSGATEALADCFLALLQPGDEAVVIEPFYDSYVPQILAAGGVPKFVRLTPPEWSVSEADLRAVLGPRTKLLVLNSPMNPASKVFSERELALIARLAEEFDFYVVCDEVYEHLTFDGNIHKPLMTFDHMRERCVRIASAGKSFSFTGWKVGYMVADAPLAEVLMKAHQFVTFTTPPALQYAVAEALAAPDCYFSDLVSEQEALRDYLSDGLSALGFKVAPAKGTYFITTDISAISDLNDEAFCEFITKEARVAAIPMSAFYSPEGPGALPSSFVRFCFSKQRPVLEEALKRLDKCLRAQ